MSLEQNNKFYFFKGRVALYAILKAIGIKKNDEIILPGFTCVVVANAIKYLGAKSVYVDIDADNYNIDVKKIEEKITDKTKAIIAQHTFGIPADMDKINKIAKKYNLYVIEDSAHAIGSVYKGKKVGYLGDAAFFSTQWSKPITTGLGGFCVVNNSDLIQRMKNIYNDFIKPNIYENIFLMMEYYVFKILFNSLTFWPLMTIYRKLYSSGIIIGSSTQSELNMNKPERYELKMSRFQKKLINKELKKINEINEYRKKIVVIYEKKLKEAGFKLPKILNNSTTVYLRYPVLVKNKKKILKRAREKRIEIGDWFVSPLHPVLYNLEKLNYKWGMCPVAEEICKKIINMPTHPQITPIIAQKICDFILENNQ